MNDSKGLSPRSGKVFAWYCAEHRLDRFLDFLRDVHGFTPERFHVFRYFGDIYDLVNGSHVSRNMFRGQLETYCASGPCELIIAGHTDCQHRRRCLSGHPNNVEGVEAEVRRAVYEISRWEQTHDMYGYVIPLERDAMKKPVLVAQYNGLIREGVADSAWERVQFFSSSQPRERAVTTA